MIKKFKLLFSIMAFCLALSSLMLGVFALNTITYTISGSMEYDVKYALLDITTTVYKYVGKPLTQEQGSEYLTNYASLEAMPEYEHHYTTFDKNHMALENVEDQTINFDLKYGPAAAYYIVVNVVSQTKGVAVGATVTSAFTAENSWAINSGDTVILKGNRGKDIVFGFGLEKAQQSSNGNFTYSIVLDDIEDYDFGDAQVDYNIPNGAGGSVTGGQESITGDGSEISIPVSLNASQMNIIPIDDSADTSDPANIESYLALINLGSSGFDADTTVIYSLQNVKFYDQNGNRMYSGTMHMYIGLEDKTITTVEQAYSDVMGLMSSVNIDDCKIETLVQSGEESVATLGIFIANGYDSSDTSKPYVNSITFDIVIETIAGEPVINKSLCYDYRYAFMSDGSINVIPGRVTNTSATIIQSSTVDIIAPQDYVFDLTMTVEEAMVYIESLGTVVPDNNLALYGNKVVWSQLLLLIYMGQGLGCLPIPKQEYTLNIDGFGSYTFKPENWVKDLFVLMLYTEEVLQDDENAIMSFFTEYYRPAPTSLSESLTVPIHMYTLESVFVQIFEMIINAYLDIIEGVSKFELGLMEDFAKYCVKEYLWTGAISPTMLQLDNEFTDLDLMAYIYNNRTSSIPESNGSMMVTTIQQYIVVPGTTYTISNMTTFTSDFYTSLPATTASASANIQDEQSNTVYTLNMFDYTVEVDAKSQKILCVVPTKEYLIG